MATLREQLGRQRQREASRVAEDKAVEKCGLGWSDSRSGLSKRWMLCRWQ